MGFKTGDPINIQVGGEPIIKGHFISVDLCRDLNEAVIEVRTGVAHSREFYTSDIVSAEYDEERQPHPVGLMP